MRKRSIPQVFLITFFLCQSAICPAAETPDLTDPNRYLNAVRTFADNVLQYGRDTYGPKHTPLFVDGLNIHTHEPVRWISPKGDWQTATETEEWILSNFASQQTLLRTLDGLSAITGDPKYRQAAIDATRYEFDHVRTASGIFYWGHMTAYDALRDTPRGNKTSESIKLHYPYYELMWKVDPAATKKLIEALWCAHVVDWSNLDLNRIGPTTATKEKAWEHEYDEKGPTFFKGKSGGGFSSTGTCLVQAGTTLYKLSGQEQPLVWSKRLAKRFVDTRHPNTGIRNMLYNRLKPTAPLGNDLKEHFLDPRTTIFPYLPFEGRRYLYYPENIDVHETISFFLVGEMLGDDGKEFTRWALEELTAWTKASYRKQDNSFVPILTDGTSIEGYVCKETTDHAQKGAVAKPLFADLSFFWGYGVAYRETGDTLMWQMVRNIALGNDFGDIGETPAHVTELQTSTTCSDVYGLLGFLELYKKTNKPAFMTMAQSIGDNILSDQFHNGFFVPSEKHIYTRFDCYEPLALLHLDAVIKSKTGIVPRLWPNYPMFVPAYRHKQEGVDRRVIYALTESPELPLSLQEAAALGDTVLVQSLLDKGIGVDSWDDSLKKTALQRAAMAGHTEVLELLLAKGADVNGKNNPGQTPLDVALQRNRKEIVELLLANGAEASSIHIAARIGALGKVKAFLKEGVDVNVKDKRNRTALHYAAQEGQKEIIELLLEHGADVNAGADYNKTAAELAMWSHHDEIVELLIANGADISPLHLAIYLGDEAKAKSLIESGADVNRKTPYGTTPLSMAVDVSWKDIVKLLIAKGADVNAKDNWDWTPLHYATYEDKEMVELLIAHGADVNAKDGDGRTPLWYAKKHDRREIVELLKKHGAKE